MTTRARGLANLQTGATTLAVGILFWVYAEVIMRHVPIVRLSREVNLLPYFLCVIGGLGLSRRGEMARTQRFHRLDVGEAAKVATWQVGWIALLIFSMMFATQDRSISRLFLGTFLVWSWLGLVWLNAQFPRALARMMFPRGDHLPTLFIGTENALAKLADWIEENQPLGIRPVGFLSDETVGAAATISGVRWLGRVGALAQVCTDQEVGQVVLLGLPGTDDEAREIIEVCQERGYRLLIHNNLTERYTHPLVPTLEGGRHFYTLREEPLEDPFNRVIKRFFDVVVSLPVVAMVLPPLFFWVWWRQRLQAPGPILHVRERRGQRGESFRMLKFRSMRVGRSDTAEEANQATPGDARIFPFGRFMRRHSLDEFPQFWNVLRGDMSIVGPRPYMPQLDETFRQQTRGYRTRHLVKPGITGLAQSLGYRGEILGKEMLGRRFHYDIVYITRWSAWLDVKITIQTLGQVIRPPKTAY